MSNPEPVAWAIYSDDGNLRVLVRTKQRADEWADRYRRNSVPLYAAPPAAIPAEVWASVDRLIDCVEERRSIHREPYSADYNGCDKSECAWCQDTGEAIAALRKIKDAEPAPQPDRDLKPYRGEW